MIICDQCYKLEEIKYKVAGLSQAFKELNLLGTFPKYKSNFKCPRCNKLSKYIHAYSVLTFKRYMELRTNLL